MSKKTAPKVEDFMSRQLITLREGDKASQAAREMAIASIRHVPVVDAHGKLRGILSSHDLMNSLGRNEDATLGAIMTRQVHTIGPHAPAYEAVGMLIDFKINALPVVNEKGDVLGIITATDFLVVAHQALMGEKLVRTPEET
jgi:CBS domain-containing protein